MGRNRSPAGGPAAGSDCHAVIERPVASRTSDGAQQALGVARLQAGRRLRVALRQQRMKAGAADAGVEIA